MEILEQPGMPRTADPAEAPAGGDAARESAAVELRAAISLVAARPGYRVIVCGMAFDAPMLAGFDRAAADSGVVLERRIRLGGGLDVVVRSA